ncbi:MAG: phage portal protein [Clostridiales bacterium]|nr:phage portal protein [Clostridiales bacterium]
MIIYLDRDEVPNLEDIPSSVLWHLIRKAEGANGRFLKLDRYYRGQHDNLRRKPEADEVLVAVNYAKYVVDIAQGYYLGEPVKYDTNETHEAEDPSTSRQSLRRRETPPPPVGAPPPSSGISGASHLPTLSGEAGGSGSLNVNAPLKGELSAQPTEGWNPGRIDGAADWGVDTVRDGAAIDLSPLLDAYDRQHISEVDSRIGKGIGVYGECLEVCYASSDPVPQPKSAYIAPMDGILVEDSTVEHNKLFAVLWERREKSSGELYYLVTIYTDQTVKRYKSMDKYPAPFQLVGEPEQHYFGAVPVIAYENNDERQGDFEQIIPLIDAYDNLMSNRFTDKQKFVDALLVFFGMSLRDGDEEQMLKSKFIDGAPLDAKVEYIQKTFDESSVQVLADAAVREMHKMTLTVDMSDENFAGNSSGQALKLKLLTMNLLVKNKIRRMERGLKERLALYNRWLTVKGAMREVPVTDVDVVFTISTPINETEIVQMVTSLQGIVDDRTLLSQLWFIRDPAEAVRNIRQQKQENMQVYQQSMGASGETEEEAAEKKVAGFLPGREAE